MADNILNLRALLDGTPVRLKGYAAKWLADPEVRAALERRPIASEKSVSDFTRVCDQTGMSEKLGKDDA